VGTAISSVTIGAPTGGTTPYSYAITGTLPDWISFNTTTRIISGTRPATATAKGTVTITVTDSATPAATKSIDVAYGAVIPPGATTLKVTYWTGPANTLVTSAAGTTIPISRSGAGGVAKTVKITAAGPAADYYNPRFSINGGDWEYGNADDEQSYIFNSAGRGNGNYNLEVRVQRKDDSKWYSGVVKITVTN
jgi:hypothetical protein